MINLTLFHEKFFFGSFKLDKKILSLGCFSYCLKNKSTKLLYDYGFDKIPKNIDTYCTSLAFRFCEDLNYDPTYYVFADPKSVQYQEKNLTNYINKSKTQTFYLCYNNDKMFKSCSRNKIVKIKHNASGPAALEIAIQKNYDRILIIGLDHNYTWIKKQCYYAK